MCGIIGVTGRENAPAGLLQGLRRLSYRGYDSSGMAIIAGQEVDRRRAAGRVENLESLLEQEPLSSKIGIAHTRWATHGLPNETNAHPHGNHRVAIVHNGIIENFRELRIELSGKGHVFETDTDSEAIAHLILEHLSQGMEPEAATDTSSARLQGAYSIAALIAEAPNSIFAVRHGSSLALGLGDGETWLGSDAQALTPFASQIIHLEDGDRATLTPEGATIRDSQGHRANRATILASQPGTFGKGDYRHFMQKEIHEQPAVVGEVFSHHLDVHKGIAGGPNLPVDPTSLERLFLIGCGTSSYAAAVAAHWIEGLARLPVSVETASEFRYRAPVLEGNIAAVFISQSGETADTLAALRMARKASVPTVAMINVEESSMAREADAVIPTHAGPEISVASTKAFTTQLASLACLAVRLARLRGRIDSQTESELVETLAGVPSKMVDILSRETSIRNIAVDLHQARNILYLGRGTSAAVAREGALKMKEISYIHAEAYPAGEMKHGPIALVDENLPIVMVAQTDELFTKTASNFSEVSARGGRIVLLSDEKGLARLGKQAWHSFQLPTAHPFVSPLLATLPLQLLAYHVALFKGTDVDQPRNLAKSVTVE